MIEAPAQRSPSAAPRLVIVWVFALALALVLAACQPNAASPSPLALRVDGHAHAGPTCPVSRPNDPACADRPVAGAVLVVTRVDGSEVVRATTGADGAFSLTLPPGDYVLVPQPASGLLGTARSQPFTILPAGTPAPLDVAYDTGIR
jgi:hypothetical protein